MFRALYVSCVSDGRLTLIRLDALIVCAAFCVFLHACAASSSNSKLGWTAETRIITVSCRGGLHIDCWLHLWFLARIHNSCLECLKIINVYQRSQTQCLRIWLLWSPHSEAHFLLSKLCNPNSELQTLKFKLWSLHSDIQTLQSKLWAPNSNVKLWNSNSEV